MQDLEKKYEVMVGVLVENLDVPQLNYIIGRLRERANMLAIRKDINIEGVPDFEKWETKKKIIKQLAFDVCMPFSEYDNVGNFYDVTLSMVSKIPYKTLIKSQGIGKYAIEVINDVLKEHGFNQIDEDGKA